VQTLGVGGESPDQKREQKEISEYHGAKVVFGKKGEMENGEIENGKLGNSSAVYAAMPSEVWLTGIQQGRCTCIATIFHFPIFYFHSFAEIQNTFTR
jgi:hypothetical protein